MVDSMVLVVLKSTAWWLFKKGRSSAVDKLRHSGDVVDQSLCNLIASDLDYIKSELNAAKRADLLESIDLYNEGLTSISFDANMGGPPQKKMKMVASPLPVRGDVETFYKANLNLSETTKKRFIAARRAAGRALSNTKQEIMDSILAYYIKVMATLLEDADTDPARALLFCKEYLKKMNSMNTVTKSFSTEIKPRNKFSKASLGGSSERSDIIWFVCHVNRFVFDIAQLVGGDRVFKELFIWPCIEIGEKDSQEEIDPLRDPRLSKALSNLSNLSKESKKHCSVIFSFGQEGDYHAHKFTLPRSIAVNPQGQFIVVDDTTTDVFSSCGKYLYTLCLPTDNKFQCRAMDVDTDRDGNAYLLVAKQERDSNAPCYEVFVFDKDGKLYDNFRLRNNSKGRKLAVNRRGNKTEVLLLEGETGLHAMVEVYETDGTFVCQFGERVLQDAQDMVGANNGHVYVLDKCHDCEKMFIREFDENRYQLLRFDVASDSVAIAFHRASESIVTISCSKDEYSEYFVLSVYNCHYSDGSKNDRVLRSLRKHKFDINGYSVLKLNVTVTTKGRIAVVIAKIAAKNSQANRGESEGEVIVY